MQLRQLLIDPELSIRLKELGFEKETYFYWKKVNSAVWEVDHQNNYPFGISDFQWSDIKSKPEYYPAYTIAELWDFLPQYLPNKMNLEGDFNSEVSMHKNDPKNGDKDYTFVSYGYKSFQDDKVVNAIALMLIELLENKLINI